MTVSTTANTITYTGNNSTTAFAFPYLFYAEGDLVVTLDGVVQTITTHYTVTGEGVGGGGTVTFVTAPGTGVEVIIQRIVSYVQSTDLENFDGNPADVTEKQLDLLAMMAQQLNEQNDRTIHVPIGTSLTSNDISGTIDTTERIMTMTTAGPAVKTLAEVDTALDTIFTGLAAEDFLKYNGTNWINRTPTNVRTDLGLGTLATQNDADLTTDVTGILPSANGGTANGFTKFSGPTTTEKTFTLPDASETLMALGQAQEHTKTHNFNATTLTDAATIAWDAESNQVASVTLTDNRTLGAPTNLVDGATYILIVKQDGTGGRTLAYNAVFKFPGASAPTLSTGINDVDILTFISDGTNMYGVFQGDFG
jgi:hypothetical protein